MIISSLICEYNPFHNGHRYLLEQMRKSGADCIIACMSGNFTQRGTPAVMDKFVRTQAALLGGADLVLELPVTYACAGAERFASGGVFLLNALGCVHFLYFGSECGNLAMLELASSAVTDPMVQQRLRHYLSQGMTFAAAREKAVQQCFGTETASVLQEPNNILAAEYLKALRILNSPLIPRTIRRTGASHDSTEAVSGFASASLLRERLYRGQDIHSFVPGEVLSLYNTDNSIPLGTTRQDQLEIAILSRLRAMSREELSRLPDMSEGLENRLWEAIQQGTNTESIQQYAKCKRYPLSRLRRSLLHAFLGITQEDQRIPPSYLRILGFNQVGRKALSEIRRTASLPMITRWAQVRSLGEDARHLFALESRCDDLYHLSDRVISPCGTNCRHGIVIK